MSNNYKQPGDVVEVIASENVTAGRGLLVGNLFGVAMHAASSGQPVRLARTGVFEMTKATHASTQAWTVGLALYWDNTAKNVTITASGNRLIGTARLAVASPAALGEVILDGAAR